MEEQNIEVEHKLYTVRDLATLDDFAKSLVLQKDSWGFKDIEVLPAHFMIAMKESGYQIGLFDGEKLIANALAYPTNEQKKYLLHLVCTSPEYRDLGLGQLVLNTTIKIVLNDRNWLVWTLDPFDFRNMHIYITKLKAVCYDAKENYYGELQSKKHRGFPTHRVFCALGKKIAYKKNDKIEFEIDDIKTRKASNSKDTIEYINHTFNEIKNILRDKYLITQFEKNTQKKGYKLIFSKLESDI